MMGAQICNFRGRAKTPGWNFLSNSLKYKNGRERGGGRGGRGAVATPYLRHVSVSTQTVLLLNVKIQF